MGNDQQFYKRRESATARTITAADIESGAVSFIEPTAKEGDWLVSQMGGPPVIMTPERFDANYEPAAATDNAAAPPSLELVAIMARVKQLEELVPGAQPVLVAPAAPAAPVDTGTSQPAASVDPNDRPT